MIQIYKNLETKWFRLPQQLRFLLVGGFNTVLAYVLFMLFVAILQIPYQLSLIIQYILTVNISIFTMRYYVFRSHGSIGKEYFKAWNTYLSMLIFNYVFLYFFIDIFNINVLFSQAVYVIISTIITFCLHKYYSFRQ